MIDVVTDLLGKRVTVSMWLTNGPGNRDAQGEMVRLITGIVRALGAHSDCFMVLVQTEIAHRGTRKVGALTMFSIGPRGGVEVVPEDDTSSGMLKYRELEVKLRKARAAKTSEDQEQIILDDMEQTWWKLSQNERDVLDREGPACDPPKKP